MIDLSANFEQYYKWAEITVNRSSFGYIPPHIDKDDLLAESLYALTLAANDFTPAKCDSFRSYAIGRMKYACLELVRTQRFTKRAKYDKINALRSGKTEGWTQEQIAEARYFEAMLHPISHECKYHNPNNGESFEGALVESFKSDADVWADVSENLTAEAITNALLTLPPRERRVLLLHFRDDLTFRVISTMLGVSESRIYQLHKQGVGRLRDYFKDKEELVSYG